MRVADSLKPWRMSEEDRETVRRVMDPEDPTGKPTIRRHVEYAIINQLYIKELEREVAIRIAQGWEPVGGVSVAFNNSSDATFVQAMVRRTPTPTPHQEDQRRGYAVSAAEHGERRAEQVDVTMRWPGAK